MNDFVTRFVPPSLAGLAQDAAAFGKCIGRRL